jgi:hypothetical protein
LKQEEQSGCTCWDYRSGKTGKEVKLRHDRGEAKSKLFGQSGAEEVCENMEKTQHAGRAQKQSVPDTISTNPVPDKVGWARISMTTGDKEKQRYLT